MSIGIDGESPGLRHGDPEKQKAQSFELG